MGISIPEIFNVENRNKGSPEFRTLREYVIVTQDKGKASDCIHDAQQRSWIDRQMSFI